MHAPAIRPGASARPWTRTRRIRGPDPRVKRAPGSTIAVARARRPPGGDRAAGDVTAAAGSVTAQLYHPQTRQVGPGRAYASLGPRCQRPGCVEPGAPWRRTSHVSRSGRSIMPAACQPVSPARVTSPASALLCSDASALLGSAIYTTQLRRHRAWKNPFFFFFFQKFELILELFGRLFNGTEEKSNGLGCLLHKDQEKRN